MAPACPSCRAPMERVRRIWACRPCSHFRFDDAVQEVMRREAEEILPEARPPLVVAETPRRHP